RVRAGIACVESRSAQSIEVFVPEIEFLLEAQRPPLVAGARARVEAIVKMFFELEPADTVGRAVQMRPAALDAEIKTPRPGRRHDPLCLRIGHTKHHGDGCAGA